MLKYASLAAVIAAAPLTAQTVPAPAAPTQAAPAQKENPLDKVICRSEDTVGSRLKRHKVCATLREWQEQQQDNRETFEQFQTKSYSIPASG